MVVTTINFCTFFHVLPCLTLNFDPYLHGIIRSAYNCSHFIEVFEEWHQHFIDAFFLVCLRVFHCLEFWGGRGERGLKGRMILLLLLLLLSLKVDKIEYITIINTERREVILFYYYYYWGKIRCIILSLLSAVMINYVLNVIIMFMNTVIFLFYASIVNVIFQ